jgi:hypothetical protein
MTLIEKLESKYARFAIPGLIQAISVMQLGVLALLVLLPRESAMNYINWLRFDRDAVLHGQVWRLFTDALVLSLFFQMKTTFGMLFWGFVGTQVMIFFGRGVEHAWGAFRVTLYIAGWFFCSTICGLLLGMPPGGTLLAQTVLFAFATMYPDQELYVFFILPVKMKWIALISAAATLFSVIQAPFYILWVLAGTMNFLVVFGPVFFKRARQSAQVADRRARHTAAQLPEGSSFHQCSVCQKTELDDATLEFRVLDSGDEICSVCREREKAKAAPERSAV